MKIITYSMLRDDLKHYMDEATNKKKTIAITSRGKKPCIIISLDEYNKLINKKKK